MTTRGMTTPWFDPDGRTLRLRHAPVKATAGSCRCFGVRNVRPRRVCGNGRVFGLFAQSCGSDQSTTTSAVSPGEPPGGRIRYPTPTEPASRRPASRRCPIPAMRAVVLVALLAAGLLSTAAGRAAEGLDRCRHRPSRGSADRRRRRLDALFPRQRLFARRGQADVQHPERDRHRRRGEDRHRRSARPRSSRPRARGGYFARRTREIYFNGGGGGTVTAVNVDTKADPRRAARPRPHQRRRNPARSSRTPTRPIRTALTHARRPAPPFRNCSGCFPARRWKISRRISSTP